jgi:hypothetical protein
MESDMKIHLKLMRVSVICGLLMTFAAAQGTQSAPSPISVTISAPSLDVKAGSEFKVDVVMTNTSNERVALTMWPDDFRVDVRDSDGKPVGKAKQAGKVQPPIQGQGSSQGMELAPHEVYRWKEIVGKELDLSKPGKYTIQVTRMNGKTAVKSNTITITVVR